MNTQRGFVNAIALFAIVLGFIAFGGGAYYVMYQQSYTPILPDNTLDNSQTLPTANDPQISPKPTTSTTAKVSAKSCISSLYSDDRAKYDFWKNKYGSLHSEFQMYDAGSYCLLSNGTQLVSFAYFKRGGSQEGGAIGPNAAGQSIALFDANNNLVRETRNLYEHTLGDLGSPRIDSVSNGKVQFSFSSGDAGVSVKQSYQMTLSDFNFTKTGQTLPTATPLPNNTVSQNSPSTPFIKVISPNGGETLKVGQTYSIVWEGDQPYGNVQIQIVTDETSDQPYLLTNGYLEGDAAKAGTYSFTLKNWWVPGWANGKENNIQAPVEPGKYKIRLMTGVGGPTDSSDKQFSIDQ